MHYYTSMQDLIGHTPIVKLNHLDLPKEVSLFAKLELYNPSGSVKDRIGRAMINAAEEQGKLKPGGTIIIATAGNTGLGVAFAALNRGYQIIVVVPEKFSVEKQTLMHALGAKIIHTPRSEGMLGANARSLELHRSIANSIVIDQFSDLNNPKEHFRTTGPEIYEALDGNIDTIIAGAGSGGTFSGVVGYLKSKKPGIHAVLADPIGSTLGGGQHSDYNIEGIGNDFIADTFDFDLVDSVIKVNDDEAYGASRLLASKEGIFAGSSSGAALAAALKYIETNKSGNIVIILPDRGDRYFSKDLYTTNE